MNRGRCFRQEGTQGGHLAEASLHLPGVPHLRAVRPVGAARGYVGPGALRAQEASRLGCMRYQRRCVTLSLL